jgi:hypothetical protein
MAYPQEFEGFWDPPWVKKLADIGRSAIKPKPILDLPPSTRPVIDQEPAGLGVGSWMPWIAVGVVAIVVLPALLKGRK